MVVGLARATGWPEPQLLRMPLHRALLYLHAYNVSEGARTKWVFEDTASAAKTRQALQDILNPDS